MHDIILLLLTALIGLFISYFVVTVFNINSDESLRRDVHQLVMAMLSNELYPLVFVPLTSLWALFSSLSVRSITSFKWTFLLVLFLVPTFVMHYYHYEVLSILDDGWTCFLIPIMRNFITPFLQITRVLYALVVPVSNAFIVINAQIVQAWYITLTTCSHVNMFRIFSEIARALVTSTGALTAWFGYGAPVSDTNNFYMNDFVIERPINHTLTALHVGQQVLACACKRFEPAFNIFFFLTETPHMTAMIDNFFQFGIRIFQLFFRILLREFPDIFRVTFKLERAVLELGLLGDAFLFNTIEQIITLFDADFKLTTFPKEFVFSMAAHMTGAAIETAATIGIHGPLHIMASFDPQMSAADPNIWSLDHAFAKMHKTVFSGAVALQWILYVIEKMVKDTENLSAAFSSKDTPLDLHCDWARDVDDNKYVSLSYTVGCSVYNAGIVPINIAAIVWGTSTELMFKSLFTQEQNVFRTLQRWEGPSLARKKVYTCEDRHAATAYNYETNAYNSKGWIWTQDQSKCHCERFYSTSRNEREHEYNPWCGQPNLNFDVFAPLDALVMHVSHGVLGPGFGDAFPFISPIRNIDINIKELGLEKSIALPLALPPLTRTAIESMRVGTRVVLSFGDILTGHFFNYPINCGHGLNRQQLIARWESTEKNPDVEGKKDEELRWSSCKRKAYKAKKSANKRTPICDSSNDKSDCMCSYLQPLSLESGCQCIARYPDLDITASSQQVGDLIEERFTSEDVSMHWCNSMIIEWTFQNTAAFADALDYIVSLGPINPTCDVMDRLIEEKGFNVGATDQRSSSAYLMATTPTLRFTGEFINSDSKLNNLGALYTNENTGCAIKQGEWVNATNERGEVVFETNADGESVPVQVMSKAEWACDASGESITALDPEVTAKEAGCRIWGRNDFFCSAGLYIRNSKRNTMNIARQAVNDGLAIIAGNYVDVNLKTLPRLCDYERQQGAIAAMIAGIIPGIQPSLKHAFAKYLNMILQVLNVQGIRTSLALINIVSTIVQDFVKGSISKDNVEKTFTLGVETIVDGYLWALRYFWETTGEILNAVSPGAGDICESIVDIIDNVSERLQDGLMDLVGLLLKTTMLGISAITGDTAVIDEFFISFFKVVEKISLLLVKQMWVILNEIYEFFGPIGDFMKILTYGVCMAINGVMTAIESAIAAVSLGFADIGWESMKCVAPLGAGHNHTAGHIGKHFLRATDDRHLTKKIAETLDWNGTSVCDHLMKAAADYAFTELRPLEKAQWLECLEFKLIGVEMGKFFNSKTFPTDVVYNWKRKYIMTYDFVRALKIAIPHFLKDKMDWADMRLMLYDQGIDADMYITIFQKMTSITRQILHKLEATGMLVFVLQHIDPEYDNPVNPSPAAKAWRVFSTSKSIANQVHSDWQAKDMTKQAWKAIDSTYVAHTHLHRWWNQLGEETAPETDTERLVTKLKSSWKRGMSENIHKTKHRGNRKPHWLRVPIRTGIKTCSERGDPLWCTNCNIMDNAIETVIYQAEAMASFYSKRLPLVLNNVSDYFNELAEYNKDFFENRFSRLQTAAPIPKTSIRWTYHVKKDWQYLFSNFSEYVFDPSGASGNITNKENWLHQVDKFLNASRHFFTYTDDKYVSFFGYSFYHMYDYLLFSSCDEPTSIFVTESTLEDRLENMDNAIFWSFVLALIITTTTTWSAIPLVWLANTMVIGAIIGFLYMYMVYGYMLTCFPLMPYTFVEDIYGWYATRIDPGCFYKMFEYMAIEPVEDICTLCATPDAVNQARIDANARWSALNASTFNTTTGQSDFNGSYYNITLGLEKRYINCAEYRSSTHIDGQLLLPELIQDYAIFWPSIFWIRWQFPDVATFAVEYGLVDFDTTIGKLALGAWQNEPIDNVWIDCYYAMWLDNVLTGVIVAIGGYITFKLTIILVNFILQVAIFTWYLYTTISYISMTVEHSVVVQE